MGRFLLVFLESLSQRKPTREGFPVLRHLTPLRQRLHHDSGFSDPCFSRSVSRLPPLFVAPTIPSTCGHSGVLAFIIGLRTQHYVYYVRIFTCVAQGGPRSKPPRSPAQPLAGPVAKDGRNDGRERRGASLRHARGRPHPPGGRGQARPRSADLREGRPVAGVDHLLRPAARQGYISLSLYNIYIYTHVYVLYIHIYIYIYHCGFPAEAFRALNKIIHRYCNAHFFSTFWEWIQSLIQG